MSKEFTKTLKTGAVPVSYVYVTGEGRDTAMKGQPARMQYVASCIIKKDSPEHKAIQEQIDAVWIPYKEAKGLKGGPSSNGIKAIMKKSDELDQYGDPIMVETDEVIITFKTDTKWPDGKDKKVQILQPNGADVTDAVRSADWTIGNGSICIIHGVASPNDIGGKDKVTLYLQAIQFAGKLNKYKGTQVEADEVEGVENIDLDGDIHTTGDVTDTNVEQPKVELD